MYVYAFKYSTSASRICVLPTIETTKTNVQIHEAKKRCSGGTWITIIKITTRPETNIHVAKNCGETSNPAIFAMPATKNSSQKNATMENKTVAKSQYILFDTP